MTELLFIPEVGRTAAVDLAIRRSLADSVGNVLGEVERAGIAVAGDLVEWRARLLAQPAPPRLWARYHELVQAVVRLDAATVSAAAADLLAGLPAPRPEAGTVVTLTADWLEAPDVARYRAVIDNDAARPLDLVPAPAMEVARVAAVAAVARALLLACCPALADEVDTLGHEIVLATGRGPRGFGGAATVFLWGAVVLNPERVPDPITLVEGLAHECAHALLFGLTTGADLTTNGAAERYSSPLRPDPRPIEGIVHATYVLARMVYALDQLRGVAGLGAAERASIEAKLARNLADYAAGLATVEAHARFTPEGAEIFAACREAMAARGIASP